jgi:hypothetical protein
MKATAKLVALCLVLTPSLANAIPPPWLLEEQKAKSDLVVIARVGKPTQVEGVRGVAHAAPLTVLETLQGTLTKAEKEKLSVAFCKPPQPAGGARPIAIGGTGHPAVIEGDVALIFLQRDRTRPATPRVVCGSFGYVRLNVRKERLPALRQRLASYAKMCDRVKNADFREVMKAIYAKALAKAEELAKAKTS